jgi:TPR repeat protein
MDERNTFAIERRPVSAIEKVAPGARQIICGMVAEVLVIARREANELEALYRRGVEYEKGGEHNHAFIVYKTAAEQGYLRAQYKLGQCYLHGQGTEGNEKEGIAWLKKALDRGLGIAGFCLGNYFTHALLPDYHEALKYFQRSVDLGCQHSMHNLAYVQEKLGKAGQTSETAAVQGAAERAERGDSSACFEMATRCLEGVGVQQSATEAFRWFREAAEQGDNADAWCYLGCMLETGQGVPANLNEAIECLRRASELGNDVAYSRLIELNVVD